MDMNQYLSVFIDEAREHLQTLNDNLLELEQNPQDLDIVHNIFRSAHTLKGMSATMGFEDIAKLTHDMENVLDLLRNDKLQLNEYIFDCLFKSMDALESMVEDIINGGTGSADVSEIVARLQGIVQGDVTGSGTAAPQADKPSASAASIDEYQYSILEQGLASGLFAYLIEVNLREDCVLKAVRAYMVFQLLEQQGEIVKSTPSVQDIEQEQFDRSFSVYFVTQTAAEKLREMILNISEIEEVDIVTLDEASLKASARSGAEPQAARETAAAGSTAAPAAAPASGKRNDGKAKPAAQAPKAGRTIRVDIERLDVLMNLFSELLIDRVRLEQLAGESGNSALIETVEHMARVSSDLQNIVMKLRMMPIDSVFSRFPRMIRDVAKSLDKKVNLVITGADTELDRTVIDEIGDPLVHLLRNAVDHGLEPTAERIAAGKDETGTIQLRAFQSGNHVFIEIEDDGKGIDREKVLNAAIKRGVVTSEQAAEMADEEVYMLLFASGFSTADKISDISGRGVGLDVVRTKIQSLGGSVSVKSEPGKGTVFSVQLPLTLSIIAAMLVRAGEEKYAIPLSSIVETAAVPRSKVREIHGNPCIEFRGNVLPLVELADVFDVPGGSSASEEEELQLVLIRKGDRTAALSVDAFIGQQEIVLKPLGKYLTNLFAISGATILGDGQVALIIDTNALIR